MHLVGLLYFLHGKSAAANIALDCFCITELHIIVIKKKNEDVVLLLTCCCHSPCPWYIICLLIIWTLTVKVLNEAQTKTLELP